uniref:Odorant-binding protein n=1 Tax=Galeruca daurica TaxID=1651263 RepID=A0A1U9W503_9CUCU|nr:odorant-binding protein [Galeruca daurica]
MKYFIVLISAGIFGFSYALKCDIQKTNGDKIRNALSKCVKNNNTDSFWAMLSENEENSSEETQNNMEDTVNNSRSANSSERPKRASNDMLKNKTMQEDDTDNSTSKVADISENCIIQCVLSNMDLVDSKGMPDQEKLVNEIVKTATTRELQTFLQESIDQCYQEMDKDNNLDDCSSSMKLVKCLADKGRENCADWPAGGLPF